MVTLNGVSFFNFLVSPISKDWRISFIFFKFLAFRNNLFELVYDLKSFSSFASSVIPPSVSATEKKSLFTLTNL